MSIEQVPGPSLSKILELICDGYTSDEIASMLGLTKSLVDARRLVIGAMLESKNPCHLVAIAKLRGHAPKRERGQVNTAVLMHKTDRTPISQAELLRWLAAGYSLKQIESETRIPYDRLRELRRNALDTLGVDSAVKAVAIACDVGLIRVD